MLFARQLSWLNAAPKQHEKDNDPKQRIETLGNSKLNCLPDADRFIVCCFIECGVCLSGGMGISPITWTELNNYIKCSKTNISGYESELIIKMSREYCNFSHKAQKKSCLAPYLENYESEDEIVKRRKIVSAQWDGFSKNINIKG